MKLIVFLGSSCPMRDLSCVASDGNNVITTTTTSDDAECGGEFIRMTYLSLHISINSLQNSAARISCVTTGNPRIVHMKMIPSLELGSSPASCSTPANPRAPAQNLQTIPSPTADTDPASLTPSNAARAQHVHSETPADLSATRDV